jgi:hypothetical protein
LNPAARENDTFKNIFYFSQEGGLRQRHKIGVYRERRPICANT